MDSIMIKINKKYLNKLLKNAPEHIKDILVFQKFSWG